VLYLHKINVCLKITTETISRKLKPTLIFQRRKKKVLSVMKNQFSMPPAFPPPPLPPYKRGNFEDNRPISSKMPALE
jgi:hypothetical protein